MSLAFDPASCYAPEELVGIFNAAFAGYVGGDIELDADSFARFAVRQGVDLSLSLVARDGEASVALALVARRGWSSRLAAMGVVPAAQRRGVGRSLLERLVADAEARCDRRYELEVIAANGRAVELYRNGGFEPIRRLLSFEADGDRVASTAGARPSRFEVVDPYEVARAVAVHGQPDLPWQIAGGSLATLGHPVRGLRLGPALALAGPTHDGSATLLALVVERRARRRGHGRRLLAALAASRPGVRWTVPALCPEEVGPFFEACAFARGAIEQLHLARTLAVGDAPRGDGDA